MIIPGFPAFMGGGKALPFLVASTGNGVRSSSPSIQVPVPSQAQVGDLIVFVVAAVGGGDTTIPPPNGSTAIFQSGGFGAGNIAHLCGQMFVTSNHKANGYFSVHANVMTIGSISCVAQFWRNCIEVGAGTLNRTGASSSTASINVETEGNAFALFSARGQSAAGRPTEPTPPIESTLDMTQLGVDANQTYNTRVTSAYERNLQSGSSGSRAWVDGQRVFTVQIRRAS